MGTAPKTGQLVILGDDTSYELARWSAEEGAWIGENDRPCKITPTHWLPMLRNKPASGQEAEERFEPAALPMAAETTSARAESRLQTVAPAAQRTGPHLRPVARISPATSSSGQIEPLLPRLLGQVASHDSQPREKDARSLPAEPRVFGSRATPAFGTNTVDGTTQPGTAKALPQARKVAAIGGAIAAAIGVALLVGMEFRTPVATHLSQFAGQVSSFKVRIFGKPAGSNTPSPAEATRTTDAGEASRVKTPAADATTATTPEAERRRADVLEKKLDDVRQEIATNAARIQALSKAGETQAALSSKAIEDAARQKRDDSAAAELQQSLRQEHDRGEALARDLVSLRADVKALSARSSDEVVLVRKMAKAAITELQQTLQQERARTAALESELAKTRRETVQLLPSNKKGDELGPLDPDAVGATSTSQKRGPPGDLAQPSAPKPDVPESSAAKGNQEADRLMERANVLLARRYFGMARSLLERAAATGDAQATFKLAETYDPLVLATWKATRTRGNARKASELYARAYDGGVKAAKDRSDALQLGALPAHP